MNFLKSVSLKSLKIVLDCANGAGYKSAPTLLKSLGAKVYEHGTNPNGTNINRNCGSTNPYIIKKLLKKYKANLGISLDGDADRVILCDENGKIADGDQIIASIAKNWKKKKLLKNGVVGTLMSNYGLEKYLFSLGIKFLRSDVGDRHVKEMMKAKKFNLGGEQSGHIILGNYSTTGDGLLVALEFLYSMRNGIKASTLLNEFTPTPQFLENVKVKDKSAIETYKCKKSIKYAKKLIKGKGRLLVRKSGTEDKIRIMVESDDISLMNKCIKIVKRTLV